LYAHFWFRCSLQRRAPRPKHHNSQLLCFFLPRQERAFIITQKQRTKSDKTTSKYLILFANCTSSWVTLSLCVNYTLTTSHAHSRDHRVRQDSQLYYHRPDSACTSDKYVNRKHKINSPFPKKPMTCSSALLPPCILVMLHL